MNKLKNFLLWLIIPSIIGISACSTTPNQPEQKPQEEKPPVVQEKQPPAEEKPVEPIVQEKEQEAPKPAKGANTVYFAPGSYTVDPFTVLELDAIAEYLKAHNVTNIKVVGHSSRLNTRKSEERISLRRAITVAQYFQDTGLFTSDTITVSAVGATEPAGSHAEITERQNNRRVEIHY